MILYWVYASSFYFTIYGRTKRLSISSLSAPSIRVTAPDRPTYRSVRSFAVDHDPPKGTPTTQQPECCSSDSDAVGGAPPSPVGVRGWSSIALLGCGGGREPVGTCPGSGREGGLQLDFTKQKDCQVFEIHRKIERLFNVVHIVFFFFKLPWKVFPPCNSAKRPAQQAQIRRGAPTAAKHQRSGRNDSARLGLLGAFAQSIQKHGGKSWNTPGFPLQTTQRAMCDFLLPPQLEPPVFMGQLSSWCWVS